MTRYILAALLTACLALSGGLWWSLTRNDALRDANASLRASVAACNARVKGILDDKESDDAIDRIPDDGLRNVPPGWLLP